MHTQKEIQNSLVQQINDKHATARALTAHAVKSAVMAFNATREAGILLEEAKSSPGWSAIQSELDFGGQAIQMCLSFSRKYPQPVIDPTRAVKMLEDVQMITGLLPFPDGHGSQRLHTPNFFSEVNKQLGTFRAHWRKHFQRSPIDKMDDPALEQLTSQMKPAVEEFTGYYNDLKNELYKRTFSK